MSQELKIPYYMKFSRHLNFAILRNSCTMNHFNLAVLNKTLFKGILSYPSLCTEAHSLEKKKLSRAAVQANLSLKQIEQPGRLNHWT